MRISTAYPQQFNINSMFDQQSKLNETQLKLSSGKKYLTPAENPSAAAYSLSFKQSIGEATQYQDNIGVATQRLGLEETTLANVIDTIQRLQELGLQGVSDSGNSVVGRNAIASEFDQLNQHLISLANTRNSNGEYLFAGTKSTLMPFSPENANSTVTISAPVAANGTPTTTINSASGGTGVTEKNYTIGSAGGDFKVSYNMDTVPDKMDVYVNDQLMTSTNNSVSGAGTLTIPTANLPAGAKIKVVVAGGDSSSWRFNVNYSGGITEDGTVAGAGTVVEAQAATTTVDGSIPTAFPYLGSNAQRSIQIGTSRTITDGDTGTAVFVSTSTGKSLFDTVKNFSNELRADKPTLETLHELDDAMVQISTVRSNVGARQNALDRQKATNQDFIINTQTALSQIEDLDYATAITNLNSQQTSLQAAQQSYAKVQGMTLFKYL
ncbi:MAG: flagellar hook-associated protein FlgL [Methylococcales bacterium]|nr:flagellar hook-associated protein FlgL [Methylococcales bacterium]MDD5753564.1 flagellar hook-associated protein FlgL [Methylococcales bacterium]